MMAEGEGEGDSEQEQNSSRKSYDASPASFQIRDLHGYASESD